MRYLDTNIFLRFLTRDDESKAQACHELFRRLRDGEEEATTSEVVIAEVVYVLTSRTLYNLAPDEIGPRLQPILALPGLKLPGKRVYLRALDIYATSPSLDFEDGLIVARMEQAGFSELYSYDRDFDRIPEIQRLEP